MASRSLQDLGPRQKSHLISQLPVLREQMQQVWHTLLLFRVMSPVLTGRICGRKTCLLARIDAKKERRLHNISQVKLFRPNRKINNIFVPIVSVVVGYRHSCLPHNVQYNFLHGFYTRKKRL